jgi:hypothetical protein
MIHKKVKLPPESALKMPSNSTINVVNYIDGNFKIPENGKRKPFHILQKIIKSMANDKYR